LEVLFLCIRIFKICYIRKLLITINNKQLRVRTADSQRSAVAKLSIRSAVLDRRSSYGRFVGNSPLGVFGHLNIDNFENEGWVRSRNLYIVNYLFEVNFRGGR